MGNDAVNPKEFERFELSGISEELGASVNSGASMTSAEIVLTFTLP